MLPFFIVSIVNNLYFFSWKIPKNFRPNIFSTKWHLGTSCHGTLPSFWNFFANNVFFLFQFCLRLQLRSRFLFSSSSYQQRLQGSNLSKYIIYFYQNDCSWPNVFREILEPWTSIADISYPTVFTIKTWTQLKQLLLLPTLLLRFIPVCDWV